MKPNVEMVRTGIERIVPEGVVTVDGQLHEVDIICFATGFLHSDFLRHGYHGRGGVSLRDQWGDEAMAYLGITVPNFPNLFCMYGPGTNLAAGAGLFYHSEFQVTTQSMRSIASSRRARERSRSEPTPMTSTPSVTRGDRPAGVGPSVHLPQPLQERAGQGLHASPWPLDSTGSGRSVNPRRTSSY